MKLIELIVVLLLGVIFGYLAGGRSLTACTAACTMQKATLVLSLEQRIQAERRRCQEEAAGLGPLYKKLDLLTDTLCWSFP